MSHDLSKRDGADRGDHLRAAMRHARILAFGGAYRVQEAQRLDKIGGDPTAHGDNDQDMNTMVAVTVTEGDTPSKRTMAERLDALVNEAATSDAAAPGDMHATPLLASPTTVPPTGPPVATRAWRTIAAAGTRQIRHFSPRTRR